MAIIGAILGDIAGQPFEFNRDKTIDFKNIELFTEENHFTDDTVLTMATLHAIQYNISFASAYHNYGNLYPDAGYGSSFANWLKDKWMQPYNSFGDGSAMRISPVIDLFDCKAKISDVALMAQSTAICTHNHYEGIKGAVVTAICGWMAKCGASKKEILDYACEQYKKSEYAFSCELSLNSIREKYFWNDTCQGSVPVAIRCFYESESYEDFLRTAISLCGDSDTICTIGGCIAEEYYQGTGFDNTSILMKYLDEKLFSEVMRWVKLSIVDYSTYV